MNRKKSEKSVNKDLDINGVSEVLGINVCLVRQLCQRGVLNGAYKAAFKGKVKKWFIPKKTVDEIVHSLKYISDNYYSVNQLANKLGVHRVTVLALIDRRKIKTEEITVLNSTNNYISKKSVMVKKLLSQKEIIDSGLFLSRSSASSEFGVTVAIINNNEKKLSNKEKFYYFDIAYLEKEALRRVLPDIEDGYITIHEAGEKLQLTTKTLASYCSTGKIEKAYKVKGTWTIPCDYVEKVLKSRREQLEFGEEFMTLSDFCNQVGQSWKVVKTRIKNGKIPDAIKINDRWVIPFEKVSKYIDNTEWLQRKHKPRVRQDDYYSKDSMLEEFKRRISEVESPHLPRFTELYVMYFEEIIGKTRQKGYKLKSLTTSYFNVYQRIILLISVDIGVGIEDAIEFALLKTKASHSLQITFSAFLKFAFAMENIKLEKSFKVSRKANKEDNELEPYPPSIYQEINLYARELDEHIPRAIKSASYSHMWVYVLLHLTDVWRHTDIIEKMPSVTLERIGIKQHSWFKGNRLTLEQCQLVINELRVKLRPQVTNKTRAFLTFLVEPTLVECVAHAVVISEIHRRKKNANVLLYTFVVRENVATVSDIHRSFFDRKPELKEFKSRKMNRSTMTYLYYHIAEEDADNADMALSLARVVRSHEQESSTSVYIKLMNKDGSVNRISSNLFQRGHFGWLYNYMILAAIEDTEGIQSLEERTRTIETFRKDISPKELESWTKLMNGGAKKREHLILQFSRMPKEELVELVRKVFNQQMPAKTNPGQCIVYNNCKYPGRKDCFGCEYFIPQFYVLIEAATEFRRVIKSMLEARFETTFIRDKKILMTILSIFNEAYEVYNPEQISGFLSKSEMRKGVNSIQKKFFVE
ncbi:hypothetical protein [Halobacillus faecis]